MTAFLALAHWRRSTAEMYAAIRRTPNPVQAWHHFVSARNDLFKHHSQSPLTASQRKKFAHLPYYPYDPAFRVTGKVEEVVASDEYNLELADDGQMRLARIAAVHFEILGQVTQLSLFWVQGYGGGLFLPFKDLTSQSETFGGGRYLYDTIKGADLGVGAHTITLDFNFAYNPSCAYNAEWVCPLAPAENTLKIAVPAGEKRFVGY